MKSFELAICYNPGPVRPAKAWFVAGSVTEAWLEEICQWGVPLGSITIYLLPAAGTDRTARGALIVVRGDKSPAVSPRAIPYGAIAERLYVPIEATLWPPVTDSELAALLPDEIEAFAWHPAVGLVGFEPDDGLPVTELLELPPSREAGWDRARPGLGINTRLRSVEPDIELTAEMIMDEGRGDIGSEAAQLPQQPAAPGGSFLPGLKQLGAMAVGAAAQGAMWLIKHLPQSASSSSGSAGGGGGGQFANWLSNLAKWAAERVNLESQRARELRRLLHMLASDPDKGLKFALPFGGNAHRGQAPPSAHLAQRNVNFNLSGLGGGAAADYWDVPAQIQQELIREYRRLAERELHLGRHRRAAYIFAELLNDIPAAAATLASGGHYREAAVLYRDRLKQPLDAAKCLEQGGMWQEALRLYDELHEFEKAGDLARRLDQPEDAGRYYRLEVDRILQRSDYLAAAKLLERKLDAPDEALEQLLRGWSSLPQHRQCVGETFRLLGRLGRHDAACEQLTRCIAGGVSSFLFTDSAGELTEVARGYPDETVRAAAADTVRRLASSRVREAPPDERRVLLDAVAALVPEDRLLSRDCRRYLEHRPYMPRSKPPQPPRKAVREAEFVREILLPPHVRWTTVRSTENFFYAAGLNQRTLNVIQGSWSEQVARFRTFWSLHLEHADLRMILEPDPHENHPLHVHLPGGPTLAPQVLRPGDEASREMSAQSPPWATSDTLAMTRAPYGVTWAINRSAGGLALAAYNSRNRPLASRLIEIPSLLAAALNDFPIFLQVRDQRVYIGVCDRLIVAREQGDNETVGLPGVIHGLACSAAHSRRRVAVTYETGGQLFWDDVFGEHSDWFAQDLAAPHVEFAASGLLIAAASSGCQIYSTSDHRCRLVGEGRWGEGDPISVVRTGMASEFAVCFADGRILVYRIPDVSGGEV